MIVWGGGHADYAGNELYAFDLRTGTWSQITPQSQVPEGTMPGDFFSRDPLPDGQPVSRHSYDGVEFLPDLDLLWAHGGSRALDGLSTRITWFYDANSGWSARSPMGPGGVELATAYDPGTRRVLIHGAGMCIYEVNADTWSCDNAWGFPPLWPRHTAGFEKTAVVDTRRGLFWSVGGRCPSPDGMCYGTILVWNVAEGRDVTDDWVTTGAGEYDNGNIVDRFYPEQHFRSGGGIIYYANAPGIDYDSAADDLVAWPNQGPPYALDLETKEWTVGETVGAPVGEQHGTYGRWRYVDAYNVFILVNRADDNVYFYKITSGCGR
jgi:hypothetical protein